MRFTLSYFGTAYLCILLIFSSTGFLCLCNKITPLSADSKKQKAAALAAIVKANGELDYEITHWADPFSRQASAFTEGSVDTEDIVLSGVSFKALVDSRNYRYSRRANSKVFGFKYHPTIHDPAQNEMLHLSDETLKCLQQLDEIRFLYLSSTDIDDNDLWQLEKCVNLRYLALGSKVTPQGVNRLQAALPATIIDY